MKVEWTTEQQKVIDLRDRNILVSAAAGSGKTAVLVERILAMLTGDADPVDVDRLLIVTFTEAAAAQMKERIRLAIEKRLEEYPDDEHLKQQATLIHNARITTIHSFCLSVVRDHFHAIDLDPGFRVGEEGELKLLRHDVMEEMLEDRYEEGSQRFLDFTLAYGSGRNDRKIEDLILKIYEYSRGYPDAGGWLKGCVAAYHVKDEEELEESRYIQLAKERIRTCLMDARELAALGLAICRAEDGPAAYEPALLSDIGVLESLLCTDTFAGMREAMSGVSWARLAANRDKNVSEEKMLQVKTVREEVKSLVKDLASQYFWQDTKGILKDLAECRPMMEELAGLVSEFDRRFEEKKRLRNMIDFSDMEQYALKILTKKEKDGWKPSAIAREYQQQFQEIMIDEYQDSNLIQEAILTSVSGISKERYNVFMVGDVKQSIYRFRLSRPELFMEKFSAYDTQDSKTQRIDLHKNFRSRREVLDSVNYMFRQIMTEKLGGIAYDEQAWLHVGASYQKGENAKTEVMVIDVEEDERKAEARAIAGRIRTLLREHRVVDKNSGQLRPVRYADIVILIRSAKGFADIFTEVLNREGIPAYAGTREGYFAAQEIGVILDYLRVLDNRRQDIALAAVLASPICGLSEDELAIVRSTDKDQSFSYAVASYCEAKKTEKDGDFPVYEKVTKCLKQMDFFRSMVPYTPMHELLWQILKETGYEDYVSAMPGGEQRKANLEMLVEKARVFESTSYKGLFHFIRYMEQLKKYDVDYGEASVEDEQSDTVRIMTIHKSKGLEFPVVFVAGMGKRFNMQDARSSVVLHARMGIGLDAVDLKSRTKSPSLVKKVIQREEALDSLGEELRVLYVALTRAKEKLILTGTLPNLEKKLPGYEMVKYQEKEELGYVRLCKAATYWDWILPSLMRADSGVPICVKTLTLKDLVREEVEEETGGRLTRAVLENWDTTRIYEPALHETMKEQFGYRYPYGAGSMRKLKFTVSELKKQAYLKGTDSQEQESSGEFLYEEPEVVPLIPRFLQGEEELSGAYRGTAYHRVMELLDFSVPYQEKRLKETLKNYVEAGKMSREMSDCIHVHDLLGFLNSKLGERMREAAAKQRLWREQPFVLGVDAKDIDPQGKEEDMILVQGIIDVYFEEADGLVLLDYKTDQIYQADILSEKYRAQLDYYARALEQITKKRVKEKIIYSFSMHREIPLP